MTIRALALLALVAACSSSGSSSDAPPAVPDAPAAAPDGSASGACFVDLSALAYSNTATCVACQQTSCDAQLTAAWGAAWKTGDYCSGGACGQFMGCMNGCHGDATCENGCAPKNDATCMAAILAANTCSDASCKTQCNP